MMVEASGLSRIYRLGGSDVVGVSGLDFSLARGSLVVLRGDSGSGKSTLLSLIGGLDRPTAGRLWVAGRDLPALDETGLTAYRRRVVGMVFQTFNLLPTLNVVENVCLPALLAGRAYREVEPKARELLQWLQLDHRPTHLPGELSGGERQRTAIARSLINDPLIILADEPTGNLDSRNSRIVMELLAELNRADGRTVIIATHSSIADPFADAWLELKDGRLVRS